MICPRCGCDQFRSRLPDGRHLVGPITEKAECIINLLMIFNCTHCGWSFLKAEGVPLHAAFARAQQR